MLAGYARISTLDQNPELQLDALSAAGSERIFEDRASGVRSDRPGLAEALDWMREGDTLVVWKLDRLGRSLPQLVATIRQLEEEGFGCRSLTEGIDGKGPWPEGRAAEQTDVGAAPPGRGDAADTRGYSFISDVIRNRPIGRTAFYHYFPKERIRELRG